jgi:hypothetical protein
MDFELHLFTAIWLKQRELLPNLNAAQKIIFRLQLGQELAFSP